MATELDVLLTRSTELAGQLDGEEALEVNAAVLDLAPGHPVATNRLGIGLIRTGRFEEAVTVLETGLLVHPDNAIMRARLEEARDRKGGPGAPAPVPKRARTVARTSGPWTDFDPEELVESALEGPGRDAAIRMAAASIRMAEGIDAQRTAVTPVKTGRRFRVIGGIFTGVAPWKDALSVAVPLARKPLIERVRATGGTVPDEPAKAVPCTEVFIPRGALEPLLDDLMHAHREHLELSIAFAPPTHLNKHHPGLRQYLLDAADRL